MPVVVGGVKRFRPDGAEEGRARSHEIAQISSGNHSVYYVGFRLVFNAHVHTFRH